MRIKQQDVEEVLERSSNPLTSTEITRDITKVRLVLEEDDIQVRRHLTRLVNYQMVVCTGHDEFKEPYYQYRHKRNITNA